jgi:ribosomal protein L6P/L9E
MLRLARLRHPRHPTLARASHIGAAPIPIPPDLNLSLPSPTTTTNELTISGPRGTTSVPLPPFVSLSLAPYTPTASSPPYRTSSSGHSSPNNPPATIPTHALELAVELPDKKEQRAKWGLTRALVANAVTGISRGFTVELNLVGVGYRAVLEQDPARVAEKGERLSLKVSRTESRLKVVLRSCWCCSLGLRIGFIFLFRLGLLRRCRCLRGLFWAGTISTSWGSLRRM